MAHRKACPSSGTPFFWGANADIAKIEPPVENNPYPSGKSSTTALSKSNKRLPRAPRPLSSYYPYSSPLLHYTRKNTFNLLSRDLPSKTSLCWESTEKTGRSMISLAPNCCLSPFTCNHCPTSPYYEERIKAIESTYASKGSRHRRNQSQRRYCPQAQSRERTKCSASVASK